MSKYYISHPTFVVLKSMPHGANMRSLLETISKAEEFSSFRIRAGEKSVSLARLFRIAALADLRLSQPYRRFSPKSTR